jgi:hypothetical protein
MNDGISLAGTNVTFIVINNIFTCSSGFLIFYNTNALEGIKCIVVENNTEILGGGAIGSKGIIGIDAVSLGTIYQTTIYSTNNTVPALRSDYNDGSLIGDRVLAYQNTRFSLSNKFVYGWLNFGGNLLGPTGAGVTSSTLQNNSITITATTTNPTLNPTGINQMNYRVIGDKTRISYRLGWNVGSAGNGSYLVDLPSGLAFNSTTGYNPVYTGSLWSPTIGAISPYLIPAEGGVIQSESWNSIAYVLPYDSNTFRLIMDNNTNNNLGAWASDWYPLSTEGTLQLEFEIWNS